MTRKERKELHIMDGLCIRKDCYNLSKKRNICESHLEITYQQMKNYRQKCKDNNKCQRCTEPSIPVYPHCEFHRIKINEITLEIKRKRIREGKCRSCGGPVHDMGKGKPAVCIWCADKNYERSTFY